MPRSNMDVNSAEYQKILYGRQMYKAYGADYKDMMWAKEKLAKLERKMPYGDYTEQDRQDFEQIKKIHSKVLYKSQNTHPTTHYIWHTRSDDKVRSSHAANDGRRFSWKNPPPTGNPGEDYNCRCWAEPYYEITRADLKQSLLTTVTDSKSWTIFDFFKHYFAGNGDEVTLSQMGYFNSVIKKAEEVMYHRLEDQIAEKMRSTHNGILTYSTNNSYSALSEIHLAFGGGVIKTWTGAKVNRVASTVFIDGEIHYEYTDEFTDVLSIREAFHGPHKFADLPSKWYVALGVTISELWFGKFYPITGKWKTKIEGSIEINGNLPE